jgi:Derlin-2/3
MEEINKIPPVTRTLLFGTLAVTVPSLIKLVNPYYFLLWWPHIVRRWQVWRLVTPFFFAGTSGLQLLFDIFMLHRNSTDLELNKFYRKTSDYAWALIIINALILLTNYPLSSVVLYGPFQMAIIYLWSRANINSSVNFFGMVNCPAKYLPYAYLGFDLLRGGMPYAIQSATGLLSAHIYYFFKEVLPATNGGRGPQYIPPTPALLQRLFPDSPDPNVQGQTAQPGGSVRSTGWGGTAFAPAGRSFGDTPVAPSTSTGGGHRLNERTGGPGGLRSWLPFGGGQASTPGRTSTSGSTSRSTQPDREAMLAAAEARLRALRANSIAGRNEAASQAASRAANSSEAKARASKITTSSSILTGDSSRSTGVRRAGEGNASTRRTTGNLASLRSDASDEDDGHTASSSGGRVAEIRKPEKGKTGKKDTSDGDQSHAWGSGRALDG